MFFCSHFIRHKIENSEKLFTHFERESVKLYFQKQIFFSQIKLRQILWCSSIIFNIIHMYELKISAHMNCFRKVSYIFICTGLSMGWSRAPKLDHRNHFLLKG